MDRIRYKLDNMLKPIHHFAKFLQKLLIHIAELSNGRAFVRLLLSFWFCEPSPLLFNRFRDPSLLFRVLSSIRTLLRLLIFLLRFTDSWSQLHLTLIVITVYHCSSLLTFLTLIF